MTTSQGAERERVVDLSFLGGVALKVINAIFDLATGIPLLFLTPDRLSDWASALTAGVLAQNPGAPLANYAVNATAHLTESSLLFSAAYFLLHGCVKVGVLIALVRGSQRVYPWAIGALGTLLLYQVLDFGLTHSLTMLVLSALDVVVIWLTLREWRHGRLLQDVLMKYAPERACRWPFPSPRPRNDSSPFSRRNQHGAENLGALKR